MSTLSETPEINSTFRFPLSFSVKIMIIRLLFIPLFVSCSSGEKNAENQKSTPACEYYADGKVKSVTESKNGKAHGLMKNYTAGGTLESVYSFSEGKREGPAVIYYNNGKPREKMLYREGLKTGTARMYYRSGELYRESVYEKGKLDGLRKSFYKDGTLMAEAPYKEGHPGLGLKEYNSDGELLKDFPLIKIEEINHLALKDRFTLKLRLEPPQPGTIFYIGDLKDGRYLHEQLWPIKPLDGVASYAITVAKGGFRMEVLTISARYKTDKSNYGVVLKKYNLALDNK